MAEKKYLKPQKPILNGKDYIYPLTAADQVIRSDGSKLEIGGAISADLLDGKSSSSYVAKEEFNKKIPFSFGVNNNGNYGYYKDNNEFSPFIDGSYINSNILANIPFETMEKDNAIWLKVFYHDITNSVFFTSIHEMEYLIGETDRFSILGLLSFIKRPEEKYEFLIYYPELGENYWNRWSQNSHPLMTYDSTVGYNAIKINYPTYFTNGCSLSASSSSTFADCQTGDSGWWFPIGQRTLHEGGTPGINGKIVKKTYLYLRIK